MGKAAAPTSTGSALCICFGCGQPGHKITDFPVKNAALPTQTPARQTPIQGTPYKNIAGATRCYLNHLIAKDAQNTPDVVYAMFIVLEAKLRYCLILMPHVHMCPPFLHESIVYQQLHERYVRP